LVFRLKHLYKAAPIAVDSIIATAAMSTCIGIILINEVMKLIAIDARAPNPASGATSSEIMN